MYKNSYFLALEINETDIAGYSILKYFFKASLKIQDLGRSNSFAFLSNSFTYSSSTSKLNLTFAMLYILHLFSNILYVIICYLNVIILKYNIIESIKYYYNLILFCRMENFKIFLFSNYLYRNLYIVPYT